MATLSQLHLAGAAAAASAKFPSPSSRNATARGVSCPSLRMPIRGTPRLRTIPASPQRGVVVRQAADQDRSILQAAKEGELEGEFGWLPLKAGAEVVTTAAVFLQTAGGALAKEDVTRFSPDEWIRIYITTGAWVVAYFVVIPLVIYNYLRLRWYKRTFLETYFQFMLVFIFFPGMLLLAPFINFRRLPNDGAEEP